MPGGSSARMFITSSNHARKWGEKILNGESVPIHARLIYWLGELLVYGPLKNRYGLSRIRVAYTAGEAIGPEIFRFYRSLGINLKQLYGQTEASVYITAQPDGEIFADTVGKPNRRRSEDRRQWRGAVPLAGRVRGLLQGPGKDRRDQDAGRLGAYGRRRLLRSQDRPLKIIDRAKDVGRLKDGTLFAPKYIENKLKFYPNIKEAVALGDKMRLRDRDAEHRSRRGGKLGGAQQRGLWLLSGARRASARL
jgi:long-chain acyl-CoA synthetase